MNLKCFNPAFGYNHCKIFWLCFLFQQFFEDGARIEGAFRKHFHRAEPDQKEDSFEIVVCHANVIRYFVCRLV